MKRFVCLLLAVALLCGCLAVAVHAEPDSAAAEAPANSKLQFRQDGSFKIIQVSDLQETFFCSTITQEWLYDMAARERPDLFVLTGDNIAGGGANWGTRAGAMFAVKHSIDAFMNVFDRIYKDFGTPVTMVFGNHDNEDNHVGRAGQFAMYQRHKCFIGWA
ncbi:MAG: metallophosphoesterase, partial [Oscillospiraceae bacterium]|nr:metallophosphoesterase [Oscillospiraceae bacterium]